MLYFVGTLLCSGMRFVLRESAWFRKMGQCCNRSLHWRWYSFTSIFFFWFQKMFLFLKKFYVMLVSYLVWICCIRWWLIVDVEASGVSEVKEAWESQRKSYTSEFFVLDPSVVSPRTYFMYFYFDVSQCISVFRLPCVNWRLFNFSY